MVKRIFVEKKDGFDVEARNILADLRENLGLPELNKVRVINRYDVEGITEEEYLAARQSIFSEPNIDHIYDETLLIGEGRVVCIAYLPGQYDQRADSAAQCIQLLTQKDAPAVRSAKLIVVVGPITDEAFAAIKKYLINPVDSMEVSLDKPASLHIELPPAEDVPVLGHFIDYTHDELVRYHDEMGLAMTVGDLAFVRDYFRGEGRAPTLTELKVVDTYWSDHCRHTTFATQLEKIDVEDSAYSAPIRRALDLYFDLKEDLSAAKPVCLMDMATIGAKALKKAGKLTDLDESEEINACSINVPVDVDGRIVDYVVMFKNETHNHPTEIEPFGGAATCLGGAIRDPLSGRSYVYQAMRVTGSGDIRASVADTIEGKLPQRKISTGAAQGYSSYGNQIGLATGLVNEIYDEGYVAKRLEIGAVIGAAPKKNIVREPLVKGDVIVLIGGRTGRDGCGGATGSSKVHTLESINTCGAEVQKGNAPTERKLQRLFRNPEASRLIKKCNDFGAGGVCVAIGELADGLDIDLDKIKKKYDGLDGTELAISESQERMAVAVSPQNAQKFIDLAYQENLEADCVAVVTDTRRLRMTWRGKTLVDISRDFLNTNGVTQKADVLITPPDEADCFFDRDCVSGGDFKNRFIDNLRQLNVCSQKGLSERFDATIGRGSVLMPFGGKYQYTPAIAMAAKIPLERGNTDKASIMTYGYMPEIAKWSPYHGALYAVIQSLAKITAAGGHWKNCKLTFQEFFERLGDRPARWGKPAAALLGALYAQLKLGVAAIGGKDSMSGSFMDMDVPPTLVSFAVTVDSAAWVISPEFKTVGSKIIFLGLSPDKAAMPDFEKLTHMYSAVHKLIHNGRILAASTVESGGLAACVAKMCFGNMVGVKLKNCKDILFKQPVGSLILEVREDFDAESELPGIDYRLLGVTTAAQTLRIDDETLDLQLCLDAWLNTLTPVYPIKAAASGTAQSVYGKTAPVVAEPKKSIVRPKVFIPVFPGTNCEYDTAYCLEQAGADCETFVVNNLNAAAIDQSIRHMEAAIKKAQIIMIPGGFSGGDEPDGSGKFIATTFRNARIKEAVYDLLRNRDGLILGICNGFQALIKLGLVPFGEIRDIDPEAPTLTYNTIGRHMSSMVNIRVASKLSPWLNYTSIDDIYCIPVSHGEGRFVADEATVRRLIDGGQIATQYVDFDGRATMDMPFNPNGSVYAVEGITSPDGRVYGKMGHSERVGIDISKNVPGNKDMQLFKAGVDYFK